MYKWQQSYIVSGDLRICGNFDFSPRDVLRKFLLFYIIFLKGREESIIGPLYLENDKYFEKHYWTKVVQTDVNRRS